MNIVPHDFIAESRCARQRDVPVRIDSITRAAQVGMRRVVIDARRQESLFVVLAGVFTGRSEHLQIAEPGHVDFAAHAVRLAHDRRFARTGNTTAVDVDAAHVRCAAQNPVRAGEDAASGDFG